MLSGRREAGERGSQPLRTDCGGSGPSVAVVTVTAPLQGSPAGQGSAPRLANSPAFLEASHNSTLLSAWPDFSAYQPNLGRLLHQKCQQHTF